MRQARPAIRGAHRQHPTTKVILRGRADPPIPQDSTAIPGLALAAQTSRPAYSSVAILATFVLSATMATILLEATDPELGRFALLLSPFHLVRGFTLWFFGVSPGAGSHLAGADLPGAIYAMSALLIASLTVILLLRRYQRISA